jgi:hypothetical protein
MRQLVEQNADEEDGIVEPPTTSVIPFEGLEALLALDIDLPQRRRKQIH